MAAFSVSRASTAIARAPATLYFSVMVNPENRKVREGWPVRVYRLGQEPGDDLSGSTTPEQRLQMVWELTERMWELSGRPSSPYSRASMPGQVIRPS